MIEANNIICNFIYKSWISTSKSQRAFAIEHNVEESIVRKIKKTALKADRVNYNIPVNTLGKICEARNLKLYDFFKMVGL